MKILKRFLSIVFVLLYAVDSNCAATFDGVRDLVSRRVPWLEKHIQFKKLSSSSGGDCFILHTVGKKLVLQATGANAAAVGVNWYLRYYCHRSMSHLGDQLAPVTELPVIRQPITVKTSSIYRYALNYCTFNYTMSFYDWDNWQWELDWMALNGVNLMLVANGSEAVWQNTLRRMGYSEKEIADFITGPAYNAWWLMGNIEGWGGPMPQSQIDSRKKLVQKMLKRMKSLGIEPLMPGFYGMVPSNLKNKSKAHIIPQGTWGAFTRPDILDPMDPEFDRIAAIFYEETRRLYGSDIRFFSGDPFHEGGTTDGVTLGDAGRAIQKTMQKYFPESIWVLQGWQDNPKPALLEKLDKRYVLVQELFGENTHNWETRKGYEGTPFIWATVTNFGERPGINGKLQRFADEVHRASNSEYAEYMKGVGILPEGINNNPIAYELLLELVWHKDRVDVDRWVESYATARYGRMTDEIRTAWKMMLKSIYSSEIGYQEGPPENILCARPAQKLKSVSSWGRLDKKYDTELFKEAALLFARALPEFRDIRTYRIDLIHFLRQVIANDADAVFNSMMTAWQKKNTERFEQEVSKFLRMIDIENELLAQDPFFRLSTWQQQAKDAGNTAAEKKNNFHNLMMLITYWGEHVPSEDNLHDYAYKEWAGMMNTYYKERWMIYFDYLRALLRGETAQAPDYFHWEREWVEKNLHMADDEPRMSLDEIVNLVCSSRQRIKIDAGAFHIDGKDVQLICGEMHYARIPHEYWRDRLKRARAMGLNTVSVYVFWNFHESQPGKFDFSGQADVAEFVRLAHEEDLYVILRPGPYACAEWDFGGYPSWLLKEKGMVYRSKDPRFLKYCERYIKALGKQLAPLTINNGSNILMVQVENEYGSYGADKEYLAALRDMIKGAGFNVPLFTCDGGGQVEAGHIDGALPTLNGVFSEDIFKIVDKYHPGGPYFVAEFYPAWFDVWGQRHSTVDYKRPAEQLDWMLEHGVSVSMYMFHGGTNFWYMNGANTAGGYRPQPTSYDYDAPLGEWGNCYPKYHAFRKVIQKHLPPGTVLPEVPADNPTTAFAAVELKESAPLQAAFHHTVRSENVLSMEDLGVDFGYIHYQTTIDKVGKHKLIIQDLRDYAVILVDGKQVASLDRRYNQNNVMLDIQKTPAILEILVENTGRVNYGPDILFNRKGITNQVLWGGEKLTGWSITSLPLYKEKVSEMKFDKSIQGKPAFHKGIFTVRKKGDCFVDMSRWGKGAVWVNGKSLGRFWNIGPQQTLYLPAPWLKEGENEIIVFEMEDTGNRTLQGLDRPILDSLGVDKNYKKGQPRMVIGTPTLEEGDIALKISLKEANEWQQFDLPVTTTFRHFCIETLTSYTDDNQACISEVELLDDKGQVIDKTKWKVVYVDSELSEQNLGVGENLYDGDISSFWHTNPTLKSTHPHHIIIDMQEIYKVSALRVKVREGAFLSGKVKDIRLYTRPQFFLFH